MAAAACTAARPRSWRSGLQAKSPTNCLLQSQPIHSCSRKARASTQERCLKARNGKTRVSVINLAGLASEEARDSFVNRLQMSLFTFIRRNPSRTGRLYVIDEAQNFAPSGAGTACKASVLSLAAQARKYGLGMMFATQTPKGVDNKIISNSTTHVYGRMNAPATIDAIHDLMAAKGGAADDIGQALQGRVLFFHRGLAAPVQSAHAPMPKLAPPEPADA